MTAEERNRRIKYGHDVPRWWIPDFNVSQELPSRQQPEGSPGCAAPEAGEGDDDYQVFERRRRQLLRREQARRRSRNLRLAQRLIAVLIAVVAYLAAGLVGLAIGVAVGVLLISLRLEF
jgi:predicted nucleic acid-binding Zn ribbon protein